MRALEILLLGRGEKLEVFGGGGDAKGVMIATLVVRGSPWSS